MDEDEILEIDLPSQQEDFSFPEEGELSKDVDTVTEAACKAFGIKYLFPWQRIVIANILDSAFSSDEEIEEDEAVCKGRQIVLLPTGAGKSLCFLTPALILPGPTLVLYPLLALMADQKRRMDAGGLKSVVFKGGQSREEREENFKMIRDGAKIILANPEVLQNPNLVKELASCNISHIAIDEAHCVSEWGDSFRPAYLTLGSIIQQLNVKVVTAFTATASPKVLSRVSDVLFGGQVHIVRSDSDRPNIHYNVVNTFAKKKEAFRLALSKERPLLIFCGTRAKSEGMARELAAYFGPNTDKVRFYHAGLPKDVKTATEQWFYNSDDGILCATCAYGMGVDKKNIKTVIHLESSENAECYLQESGRAVRDGSIGNAILLWSPEDTLRFKRFPEGSRQSYMLKFAIASTCRRQVLLDALGAEEAACDGCDVCKRGEAAPFALDAEYALNFIKKHKKLYNYNSLLMELENIFNKRDLKAFKMNIWDSQDIRSIFRGLKKTHKIKTCFWPWSGRITVAGDFVGFWKVEKFLRRVKRSYKKFTLHLLHLLPDFLHFFQQRGLELPFQQ